MKLLVKCVIYVPIEVSDSLSKDEIEFDIEDNHCPGTGVVGMTLDRIIDEGDNSGICWACTLGGTNEIVNEIGD